MAAAGKDQTLLPAYLVVGEDALKRETALRRLRARIARQGDLSFNSDAFDGEAAEGAAVVTACNTVPFASPVRLVEVRNVGALRKADADAVAAYLGSPCPTTVLALSGEKLAKGTRLYKAVAKLGKTAVIDCTPPARKELAPMVRRMAQGKGVALTPGAADKLIELVGQDTVRLDAELSKLALGHQGADAVNEHEVSAVVGRTSEAKPWDLVDAFSARNLRACLDALSRMPSASPHALLPQCTRRVRELICARSLAARGRSSALAQTLGQPDWKARKVASWARNYSDAELRRALVTARDAELAMKSGADPDAALIDWLVAAVAAPRRPHAG